MIEQIKRGLARAGRPPPQRPLPALSRSTSALDSLQRFNGIDYSGFQKSKDTPRAPALHTAAMISSSTSRLGLPIPGPSSRHALVPLESEERQMEWALAESAKTANDALRSLAAESGQLPSFSASLAGITAARKRKISDTDAELEKNLVFSWRQIDDKEISHTVRAPLVQARALPRKQTNGQHASHFVKAETTNEAPAADGEPSRIHLQSNLYSTTTYSSAISILLS